MASEVDICNIALSHIGADAVVAAIDPPDGSAESGHCARFYPLARRELLQQFNFDFCKTRVLLAEMPNTSTVWQYAYAMPADVLMALRVLPASYLALAEDTFMPLGQMDVLFEGQSARFEVESGVLRTNEPEAVLLYKRDETDPARFPPLFTAAAGMLLASYVAGPIIKGMEGARIGAQWREAAYNMARSAAAASANAASERADHEAAHLAARR